jgi:putative SOS response-associated peptidase YedK
MCGRYTLRRIEAARQQFDAIADPTFEEFSELRIVPRFNIAPSQDVAVVRINAKGDRVLGLVQWGLVPHWTKGEPKLRPINAKAETVATSGMFRQAFSRRRCLVPADGFYEWRKIDLKTKQPMFMHFPDDRVFAFAGLWERWTPDEQAEPVDTCTIVTTSPNELMKPIHDRMPVILRPEDYGPWLDKETDPEKAQAMLRPYADDELEAIKVSTLVNSPKNISNDCVRPLAEE